MLCLILFGQCHVINSLLVMVYIIISYLFYFSLSFALRSPSRDSKLAVEWRQGTEDW